MDDGASEMVEACSVQQSKLIERNVLGPMQGEGPRADPITSLLKQA